MKATVLLICIVFLAGCAQPSKTAGPYDPRSENHRDTHRAQELNAQAARLMDADPDKAERLLREALSADLYFGPAHNNLGVLQLRQGKLYEAANEFEWARKLMPGHPDPRLNLALTLERAGRNFEAIDAYHTALEVHPGHLPTMQALARLQVRSGRVTAETQHMLDEIALRGETEQWREWAKWQRIRLTAHEE